MAVLQILYTSFTARQLEPVQFGYYAIAQALAALMGFVSFATLGSAVARVPDEKARGLLGRAALLAVMGGVLASGLTLALGEWWTRAWGDPSAIPVARLMAVPVFLAPVNAVAMGLLRRQMKFRSAAMIDVTAACMGFGVGAVMVWQFQTAAGLVLGQCVMALTSATLSLLRLSSVRHGETTSIRHLMAFSAKVSGQNIVHYLVYNMPAFAVSSFVGAVALGIYSRAYLLVALPLTQVSAAVTRVLYPLWGRIGDESSRRTAVTETLVMASLVSGLLFGLLCGLAGPTTAILLGSGFRDATPLVRVLCIFAGINFLVVVAGTVLESLSWLRAIFRAQVITVLSLAPLMIMSEFPVTAIGAWVLACSQLVAHGMQLSGLARNSAICLRPLLTAYVVHYLLGATVAVSTWLIVREQSTVEACLRGVGILAFWGVLLLALRNRIPGLVVLRRRLAAQVD